MKNLYNFLRFTLVVLCICTGHVSALAYDFIVDGIAYNILDNEVEVTSNIPYQFAPNYGGMSIVNVPSTVHYGGKTYAVTAIGVEAFNSSKVKEVNLPNTVKVINEYAFADCGITSIDIPNSVTRICSNAFANGLFYTAAPLSLKSPTFNVNAYGGGLTSLYVPSSVTVIEPNAFYGCSDLDYIKVNPANPVYDSRNDCNALIETATGVLLQGCRSTIIPNDVTGIGEYAFVDCRDLTEIDIPEGVTTIGYGAFSKSGLTRLRIPNSTTRLEQFCFCFCENLTDVIIGESVEMIGIFAFDGDHALRQITCKAVTPPRVHSYFNKPPFEYENITLRVPAEALEDYKAADVWKEFPRIEGFYKGDVNDDKEVNIQDINLVINLILNDGFNDSADVNGDGEVTIADINAIISIVLKMD